MKAYIEEQEDVLAQTSRNRLYLKFINVLMRDGKKATVESQVHKCFLHIKETTKKNPIELFNQAIEKIKPSIELKTIRVSGKRREVPVHISQLRQESLALRNLVSVIEEMSHKKALHEKLYIEIMNILSDRGVTLRNKQDMYKRAEANRAFAHYRW